MTFRYIGSKSRLIDQIKGYMGQPNEGAFFVDAFCGTGVVAEAASDLGWNVRINDSLHSAVISAGARLIAQEQATFTKLGGYAKAMWCGEQACEDEIKDRFGASSRCMPFDQTPIGETCVCCGKPAKKVIYFAKAY